MVKAKRGGVKPKRVTPKPAKRISKRITSLEFHKKMLEEKLDLFIKQGARFVPECDTEYRVHVYNRVLVRDCDNITDDEKRQMSDDLIAKGERSARAICSLNGECPNFRLLRYSFDRIECENRLWEVDLTWFFKCVV